MVIPRQGMKMSTFISSIFSRSKEKTMEQLNWEDFFKYRNQQKTSGRIFAIPAIAGFYCSELFMLNQPFYEPTMTILGYDFTAVLAVGTVVGTIGTWFIGSIMGRWIWRWRHNQLSTWMHSKQRDFYGRISKYRANAPPIPTQPTQNLDFHGEKIRSVSDYRTWLRKQFSYKKRKDVKL